ncbi:MAG TPA: HEPN domain-containing protein [Firmicutes bacterium]|nr:HEPN domain-containing protein [Bacillota bacterium]
MRHEAELWVKDALYDLDCARDMLEKRRHNYAVWFSRQAAEKMLKAGFLLLLKEPIPKEHNLLALGRTLLGEEETSLRAALSFLNPHYTTTRYVDAAVGAPADLYDEDSAREAYRRSMEVIQWLGKKMGLDGLTRPG